MSSRLKLDAKIIESICIRFQNGETCSDLAKEYGPDAFEISFNLIQVQLSGISKGKSSNSTGSFLPTFS